MKHTSTVLEHSIPFHTLVKLVDAEDIANDKISRHDLALEVNTITKQLQTQTLDSSKPEQLMFTQPRDPNNKNKPEYKNIAPTVKEQITTSLLASKNNETKTITKKLILDQTLSPQKYFVKYFRSPSTDRTKRYETRYRSRSTSRNKYYNKDNNSHTRYRSTSRDRFSYGKNTTPPQYTRSRYDNYKRDLRSY